MSKLAETWHIGAGKRQSTAFLFMAFMLLSVFFGAVAGIFGGLTALLIFLPVLPLIFTLRDYRVGLVVLVLITTFQNTIFLPSFTGFNIVSYLTVATLASLVFAHSFGRILLAPFPRYIWLLFLLPIGLAAVNGLFHLNEIPISFTHSIRGEIFATPKKYLADVIIKPLLLILVSWMLGTAVLNSKKPERFFWLLVVAPVLPALVVLIYLPLKGYDLHFLASPEARYVLSQVGLHTTQYGLLFASALSIQLFLVSETKGLARLGLLVCMSIVSLALILTFSRLGYFAAFISLMYFLVTQRKASNYLIVAVALLVFSVVFGEAIMQRVSTGLANALQPGFAATQGMSGEELTAGRIFVWSHLLPEVWRSPIWGTGVNSTVWSDTVRSGLAPVSHSHNIYLGALLDMGVAGLICLLAFYGMVFLQFKSLAGNANLSPVVRAAFKGGIVAFVGFLITSFADNRYITVPEQTYIWLLYGCSLAYIHCAPKTSISAYRIK